MGALQVLISYRTPCFPSGFKSHDFWWNVDNYANIEEVVNFLLQNGLRIQGAPGNLLKALFDELVHEPFALRYFFLHMTLLR